MKPYAIGSDDWNGLGKLVEELGELQQVCGKLICYQGQDNHKTYNVREKFVEELGDAIAAINFFIDRNLEREEQLEVARRVAEKYTKFKSFEESNRDAVALEG